MLEAERRRAKSEECPNGCTRFSKCLPARCPRVDNGKVWESLVANNVWEPGAVGTETVWREVTKRADVAESVLDHAAAFGAEWFFAFLIAIGFGILAKQLLNEYQRNNERKAELESETRRDSQS